MFKRIPILMYHTIEPERSKRVYEDEKFYNITQENFIDQMNYLRKNGFNTITIADLLKSERDDDLPPKPIMLTFDDGHISHYDTVMPILKENRFTGVFFLVSNDIGKEYRVTWDQVKALREWGMEIGSHGVNHDIINKYSFQNLIIELKASKIELEDTLGEKILAFSIPRGFYSPKISNVARGMGYKLVFTSFTGNITLYSNPYCLRRLVMRSDYSMNDFKSIVNKNLAFLTKKHVEQLAKNGLHKVMGVKTYNRIKERIFART
jgi:peptidoglycan/xylan/chitin deacetylase (PgdA/CDA1 family)